MERMIASIMTDTNRRVEVAKTLAPIKLYDQKKLNELAKKYKEQ